MSTFQSKAKDFLAQKNIAIAGVSRREGKTGNSIFKYMQKNGYQVYPINPNADMVEGETCYPDVKSIPADIDGVLIVTPSQATLQVVKDSVEAGIPRIWMHENAWAGSSASSVSQEAVDICRENGISVIAGGCPMMFLEFGHKCMRWIMGAMGQLPQ